MLSRTVFAVAIFAAASGFIAAAGPAVAQSYDGKPAAAQAGTSEENAACRRDTRRLCRHIKAGSGNDAFLHCLQENRAKLSKGCRETLESHGM